MFEDDLKSLLQIPTLTRLSLPVLPTGLNPGNLFLPTVARELQTHPSLMQELDLGRTNFLELPTEEVTYLFQTIFSLPQLSQLTLKLAYSVLSLQHYEMIHRLWAMYGSGERLKEVVCGCSVFVSNSDEVSEASMVSMLNSVAQHVEFIRDFMQIYDVQSTLMQFFLCNVPAFTPDLSSRDL